VAMRLGKPKKKPWDIIELICYGYIAEIIIIIIIEFYSACCYTLPLVS